VPIERRLLALFLLFAVLPVEAFSPQISDAPALGKAIFSDTGFSEDHSTSCLFCHGDTFGFGDERGTSVGVHRRTSVRRSLNLLDLPLYKSFFWDGRVASLLDQARLPFVSPVELGLKSEDEVLRRIRRNPAYVEAFQRLYGVKPGGISMNHVAKALVAFEQALPRPPSRIDRYLAGDITALSAVARHGMEVFAGKGGCSTCHVVDERKAPLTDNQFHASGVGLASAGAQLSRLLAQVAELDQRERFARIALDPQISDLGRYVVTLNSADIGKFRTPSLRNVASANRLFMHDGSIFTLREAIELEIRFRGLERGRPLDLSTIERDDIQVFLEEISNSTRS